MAEFYPITNLKFLAQCPLCNHAYSFKGVKVLSKKDDLIILHLTCQHCKGSVMVAVGFGVFGITSVSILTDATANDLDRFGELKSISADDVLEMHKFLENFDGRLTKVIDK